MNAAMSRFEISTIYQSPIGVLGIEINTNQLMAIRFLPDHTATQAPRGAIAQRVVAQLQHYFAEAEFRFDLPIQLCCSAFQKQVLKELQAIPTGETCSYADIAHRLSTSPRAVGNACRRNPIPIVIPCHRVVAKSHLGGYSGAQAGRLLEIKKWLLKHELAR